MGLFEPGNSKLSGEPPRHLKAERLAGHYEIFEGYEDEPGARARQVVRTARRALHAAMQREALAMGAIGLALGVVVGVTLASRRRD